MKRTLVLVVLDGWGIGPLNEANAIYRAEPRTMNFIRAYFPCGALQASGMAVGLPWEEEGNSEVGHLTLGAGRVIYQHFPKIMLAVQNGSFFRNPAVLGAFAHAKKNNSIVHFFGLLTEGNIHASMAHIAALVKMADENGQKFCFDLISDGRDSRPHSVADLVAKLSALIGRDITPDIGSIMGRYYGMDRDRHFERTEEAYKALTGAVQVVPNIAAAAETAYGRDLNDEYVVPSAIGSLRPIQDGDSVVFFNFRSDRMKQISAAFLDPKFSAFPVKKFNDLFVATMTRYEPSFQNPVAFPDEDVQNTFGQIVSAAGRRQLRVAETEKYAHVTYFFNGLREPPFPGEYRVLIPSSGSFHYDQNPAMMAKPITDRVIAALDEGTFDFILVNYANPDMVAHTGNFEATVEAVRAVDAEVNRLLGRVLDGGHVMAITADHGNAEVLLDLKTGEPETKHDPSPVPFYLVAKEYQMPTPANALSSMPVIGMLSDVAPTLLALAGLKKPSEMTGQNLLPQLIG
ncbi:2,3-bisphosphoglycerate-independent phosphoglycerate mutase [Patescibacteria group bacterium]|nr:2,3-bisphosphoglycerate-independent phosphoglycerate mutase [Patescibacteria group bacterium]